MSDFTPPTADLVMAIMRRLDLYDPKNDAACFTLPPRRTNEYP